MNAPKDKDPLTAAFAASKEPLLRETARILDKLDAAFDRLLTPHKSIDSK